MGSLAAIAADVSVCNHCQRLVAWRRQVAAQKRASFADQEYWGRGVPGFGDPRARVVVVGLAPAAHGANRTGRMFTGDRSGDWLFDAMFRAGFASQPASVHVDDGLRLDDAYVTSMVKCAPPENRPDPSERAACATFLAAELDALDLAGGARVIVCLGGLAFSAVVRHFDVTPRPRFGHGVEVALPGGRVLLASYHPSQQNTFTGRLTMDMLVGVFRRAAALASLTS
ncbi:hypothetical protein BH20ACT4_BH20ACT4_14820 [soil metagenome]